MANFELKVQLPKLAPVVFNYDELKAELSTALVDFKNRVYTEDMIADAKNDAAKLNKLKKAISDERIAQKKAFMKPFETFEAQAKEICEMIDTASSGIKEQLDTFEQKRIEEKRTAIRELFSEIASEYDALDFITLDKIFNDKWLNKTATDKAIATEITEHFEKAAKDLEVISRLPYYYEAKECYKTTLDLNKAIAEGERIAQIEASKRQAQTEAQKFIQLCQETKEEPNEPIYDFKFACRITQTQAIALKQYCNENKIKLIKI